MRRSGNQERLNSHFATEQADLQTRLLLLEDAFGAIEHTLDDLLAHLVTVGRLDPEADLVIGWRRAIEVLRREGLPERARPGEAPNPGVQCPGCSALLRNVAGLPGERCDWCGYVFVLVCPSCVQELPGLKGEAGETCPWCKYDF